MTKEKITSLEKYRASLRDKLNEKSVPTKHVNHPEQYRAYLENELRVVTESLEKARNV